MATVTEDTGAEVAMAIVMEDMEGVETVEVTEEEEEAAEDMAEEVFDNFNKCYLLEHPEVENGIRT